MILTQQLKEKFLEYLETIRGDYDDQEIKNCVEILNEKEGSRFSELDNTILNRIVDDEELLGIIDELTDKKKEENIFD